MKIVPIEFPDIEYIKEETTKEMIVYHHTVSSSGAFVDDWWKSDKGKSRVAASFIIEKDGTISQVFDPKYWAYHIGKGSTSAHNKRSIAIEIVNEGMLWQKVIGKDTKYFWLDGKKQYTGGVYKHPVEYRGSYFFASYTDAQYQALAELTLKLQKEFNIPSRFNMSLDYDVNNLMFKGIVSHRNLRADKTDVSPAFDYQKLFSFMKLAGAKNEAN